MNPVDAPAFELVIARVSAAPRELVVPATLDRPPARAEAGGGWLPGARIVYSAVPIDRQEVPAT